jgi:hypothetical protein
LPWPRETEVRGWGKSPTGLHLGAEYKGRVRDRNGCPPEPSLTPFKMMLSDERYKITEVAKSEGSFPFNGLEIDRTKGGARQGLCALLWLVSGLLTPTNVQASKRFQ